ncbi:hypothetical protein As57867_007214, partial [Aphanomyces stellatus]
MASVWARVLDVDVAEIGRQTSFYAVGGDSLSVIKVVAACKEVGITISVTQLLKHLVLWKVAASIADGELDVTWPRATLSQGIVDSIVSQNNGILEVDNCLVYPVTPLQAGMVSATLSNPSSYLMQIPMRTKQESNMANLCDAFRQIVRTNDILRTTFVTSTSGIYQVIHPATDEFKVARASTIDVDEFLRLDYARGFTIGDAYFVRLTIVGDQSCVLTIHHALYDGWTVSMIMSDLHDAMHGNTMVHRPSFCDAVDYICAQDKNATQVFWRAYLSGYEPSVVGTHQGKPFPNEHDNTPLSMISQLPLAEITAAARRVKLTVAELTKLAWANTLRKYTRQNDVVFGCVMANRNIPIRDADKILGPLLSTIPCRVTFDDSLSTEQWIDVVIAERSTVVAHAHASLLDIKRWSDIEGELFDTLFVFQNMPREDVTSNIEVLVSSNDTRFDTGHTFDLMVTPKTDALLLQAAHDPNRLDYEQARWMLHEFDHSITQLVQVFGTDITLSTLWSLSPKQLDVIQSASFGPQVPLQYELLHHAFEERA